MGDLGIAFRSQLCFPICLLAIVGLGRMILEASLSLHLCVLLPYCLAPGSRCFLSTITCAGCDFHRFGVYYAGVFFGGGASELRNLRLVFLLGRGTATYNLLLVADTVFQAGPSWNRSTRVSRAKSFEVMFSMMQ